MGKAFGRQTGDPEIHDWLHGLGSRPIWRAGGCEPTRFLKGEVGPITDFSGRCPLRSSCSQLTAMHFAHAPESRRSIMMLPRPHCAKPLDGIDGSRADQRLALRAGQYQFLVPIDDGARLEQHRRDGVLFEHDQLIVSIYSRLGIDELPAPPIHHGLGVMGRVLQAAGLELLPEKPAVEETASSIAVVVRNEDGMPLEPVAEAVFLALVFPFFQEA